MTQYKKDFIDFMIESKVLVFGDFTTKSGRKTPFFINAGNYKTGEQLEKLGDFYAKAIIDNFPEDFDILFGPAYKGIPLAVTTAISLNKIGKKNVSFCSSRKEVKDHGDTGILLGSKIKDNDKIVIIEDVTTAGTSIYENLPIIKSQGNATVLGLIISVDRMEKGKTSKSALAELREEFNFKTASIVNMEEIVDYLLNRKINGEVLIDEKMKNRIDDYYSVYGAK